MSNSALRLLTIGAVAVLVSGGLIARSAHASTLDVDYLEPNDQNFYIQVSPSEAAAQSFSPTISGQLTSVGFVIQRNSGESGALTVAIEGASGYVPNGTRLASESIANTQIPNAQGEVTINFATPTSVEAGDRYTLVLEADSGSTYYWYYASTKYPGEAWAVKPGDDWGDPDPSTQERTPAFGIYITATQPIPAADAPTSPGAHIQQFGLPDSQTCQEAAPEDLNWSGVGSGGWGKSWAQWMNDGLGGEVCTRMLVYSNAQGRWVLAE